MLIVKLRIKKCKSCKSFREYKKLISSQLLENIIAWNIIFLFAFFYFQAGLVDVFVFKNFPNKCSLLFSQVSFPRHEWVAF